MAYQESNRNEALEASSSSSSNVTHEVSQSTGQSFHLFPQLPSELQDHIWTLALPPGRFHRLSGRLDVPTEGPPPPVIAHVCRSARDTAVRHYSVQEVGHFLDLPPEAVEEGVTSTASTWFDGTRDILFIDLFYPYHDVPPDHYSAIFDAAETVAFAEEHMTSRGPLQDGFLSDVVRGERFPRLRQIMVLTGHVVIAPQSWGAGGHTVHLAVRSPRTVESYRIVVLPLIEARILKFLRIAHARLGLAFRSPVVEDDEAREGEEEEEAVLPVYHSDAADGGDGDGDGQLRVEPLSRDHPWVQRRWNRLPKFVQALTIMDPDETITCVPYTWSGIAQ